MEDDIIHNIDKNGTLKKVGDIAWTPKVGPGNWKDLVVHSNNGIDCFESSPCFLITNSIHLNFEIIIRRSSSRNTAIFFNWLLGVKVNQKNVEKGVKTKTRD